MQSRRSGEPRRRPRNAATRPVDAGDLHPSAQPAEATGESIDLAIGFP
ncbi:MAG: hypothetical protein R2755_28115 [Acidimicrobiales bacterium]